MKWIIWYDDASIWTGPTEIDWEGAPRHGVLIVKEIERKPNDLVHMGGDYYWFEEGQVKSCRHRDIDRYLIRPQGIRCVKFGRWGADDVWLKAHNEAMR